MSRHTIRMRATTVKKILFLSGLTMIPNPKPNHFDPLSYSFKTHHIGTVEVGIQNRGPIAFDSESDTSISFFPIGTSDSYIFGAGLWFGGLVDLDRDGSLDTFFVEGYDLLSANSEYREGRSTQDPDDPLARVFDSLDSTDLAEWPEEFRDPQTGDPLVLSDQDLVTIYTSVGADPIFGDRNVAVEVHQRSLSFASGLLAQSVIFIWDMMNASLNDSLGPYDIRDAYLGIATDADIGSPCCDRASVLWNESTGIAWIDDFFDPLFSTEPGFVGWALLEAPVGLTGFSIGTNNYPLIRPDPRDDPTGYRILACLADECRETTVPHDIRFFLSSGPFALGMDDKVRIAAALCFAPAAGDPESLVVYGDPPRPDPQDPALGPLMEVVASARDFYDQAVGGIRGPIHDREPLAREADVLQNYPNPFNPSTSIVFYVPESLKGRVPVKLVVYDMRGRRVRDLVDDGESPGRYTVQWDGRNDSGEPMSSGIYFYRIAVGPFVELKKMVLLK